MKLRWKPESLPKDEVAGDYRQTLGEHILSQVLASDELGYSEPSRFTSGTILLPNAIRGGIYCPSFDPDKLDDSLEAVERLFDEIAGQNPEPSL